MALNSSGVATRSRQGRWIAGTSRCGPVSKIVFCRSMKRLPKLGLSSGRPIAFQLWMAFLLPQQKVHGLTLVTRNVADIAATGASILDPFVGV